MSNAELDALLEQVKRFNMRTFGFVETPAVSLGLKVTITVPLAEPMPDTTYLTAALPSKTNATVTVKTKGTSSLVVDYQAPLTIGLAAGSLIVVCHY